MMAYASGLLSGSLSTKPTAKELIVVNRFIASCERSTSVVYLSSAMTALLEAAIKWKSGDIWVKAASACADGLKLQAIEAKHFVNAYLVFGFKLLEPL